MLGKYKHESYKLKFIMLGLCLWIVGGLLVWIITNGDDSASTSQGPSKLGMSLVSIPVLNIFLNNSLYLISIYTLGTFSFGIFTITSFVYNGLVVGLYVKKAIAMGFSTQQVAGLLALHGPIEILAFLLGGAYTFANIDCLLRILKGNFDWKQLTNKLVEDRIALLLPFVLLAIAAPIEYLAYAINQ